MTLKDRKRSIKTCSVWIRSWSRRTEGLVLQDAGIWKGTLGREVISQNNASELYFEEMDMETFVKRLEECGEEIRYVTPLTELPWGQKLVRFYDPDGNLIEVRSLAAGAD